MFFIWKNKASAPGDRSSNSNNNQNAIVDTRTEPSCEELNSNIRLEGSDIFDPLEYGVGRQPSDFPQPFGNTIICGNKNNTAFYISPASSEQVFSHYRSNLDSKGYTVTRRETDDKGNSFIRFSRNTEKGTITTYKGFKVFSITYSDK